MKKIMLTGVIASVVLVSLVPLNIKQSFTFGAGGTLQSSITGRVSPSDGAELIWAISATDSIKVGMNSGSFSSQVKPGTYKLIVDAKSPYKDVFLDHLEVKENQTLDVGEIILQQ